MTRFRQRILALTIAAALLVPLGSVASADPGDGGGFDAQMSSTTSDPGDGGGY